jgi:hypothetical protein
MAAPLSDGATPESLDPSPAKRLVAVVVPLSTRPTLTADEQIALRHLEHHLGHYDRFVAAPRSMPVDFPGYRVARFEDDDFGSIAAYNRLLLSPRFYDAFRDYEFILVHHLDALALSDQLTEWCAAGLDYIGAPWWDEHEQRFVVGNGGFSLRRIEAFLRVFRSRRLALPPDEYWRRSIAGKGAAARVLHFPRRLLKHVRRFNGIEYQIASALRDGLAEDNFISEFATAFDPSFRIASLEQALRFAFDNAPGRCFRLSNERLPFGAHAWQRWERTFWEPYLLK